MPLAPIALALAIMWSAAGVSPSGAVLAVLWAGITSASGLVVWRGAVRTRLPTVFELGIGFAVGTALHLPTLVLTPTAAWVPWVLPLGIVGASILHPTARERCWRATAPRLTGSQVLVTGAVLSIQLAFAWFDALRSAPPSLSAALPINLDVLYSMSISEQSRAQIPPSSPQVAGGPLPYHWFPAADIGLGATATSSEVWVATGQLWYPVLLVMGTLATGALCIVVTQKIWAGPLGCVVGHAMTTLGGATVASRPLVLMNHDLWHSPSTVYALLLTCALLCLAVPAMNGAPRSLRAFLIIGGPLCLVLGIAKATQLPLLLAGAGFALLVSIVKRQRAERHRLLLILGTLLAAQSAVSVVVFRGATDGLGLHPRSVIPLVLYAQRDPGVAEALLGTSVYVPSPAVVAGIALVILGGYMLSVLFPLLMVLLAGPRRLLGEPALVALAGSVAAGFLVTVLIRHPGGSEKYFLVGTAPMIASLGTWGLVNLKTPEHQHRGRVALGVGTGALMVAAVVWGHSQLESQELVPRAFTIAGVGLLVVGVWCLFAAAGRVLPWRDSNRVVLASLLVLLGVAQTLWWGLNASGWLPESTEASTLQRALRPDFVTPELVRVARTLREASPEGAVVATNRHCVRAASIALTGAPTCKPDALALSAFSGRSVLVEGWIFERDAVARAGRDFEELGTQPFGDQDRLRLNDAMFSNPSRRTVAGVCSLGATWAVIDREVRGTAEDLAALGPVVAQAGPLELVRLDCPVREK